MKSLVLAVLVIIIIGVGGYLFLSMNKPGANTSNTPTPSQSNSNPTGQAIDNSDLRQGGSSYQDANGVFNILYPSDYKLDTQDPKHPRIYKTGATQKGQTEMYDGVIIVFENIDLGNKTLSQWVDDYLKTIKSDGTSEVVEPKTSTTINNQTGFTFTTRGLGESKVYVVQKNTNSKNAVFISTLVADPENLGYQTEVNKTLSTLNLLK